MLNMLNNDLVCNRDSLFSRENIFLGVVMGFPTLLRVSVVR